MILSEKWNIDAEVQDNNIRGTLFDPVCLIS